MKKWINSIFIILLTVTLSACFHKNNQTQTKIKSSTSTTQVTDTTSTKTVETTSSSSTTTSSKETVTSHSQTPSEEKETNAPEKQAQIVLNKLSSYFPEIALPKAILTSSTKMYLTAATTPTAYQANFRILYYAEDQPIAVNDLLINQLLPIASFEKKTYQTSNEAQLAVNQINDDGGQAVDLGFGIIGHQQGAAGSSYLSWAEGNWRIAVRASAVDGKEPVSLAKEVVAYLEKAMLPAPNNVGNIVLNVYSSTYFEYNSVTWQSGNVVYSVKHFDPIQAIKMAVSTAQ